MKPKAQGPKSKVKKVRAKARKPTQARAYAPHAVWISGVTRMAQAIAAKFKTTCSKQDINFWRSQEPRFPAPRDNGEFNQEECFEYFDKVIKPKRAALPGGTGEMDIFMQAARADAEETIRDNETSRFNFDKLQGLYVERSMSERTIVGALKKLDGFYRAGIERFGPAARKQKLELLGVPTETVREFAEWDLAQAKALVDEARGECLKAAG
jgi:hypothetical protein